MSHFASSLPAGPVTTARKSMRRLAKSALTRIARSLPAGMRTALLRELAIGPDGYEVLQAVGQRFGVRDLRIAGAYGLIEGSIADVSVLRTYATRKSWAASSNAFFADLFAESGGGTYIDVGANIGLTTIPIAQHDGVVCKAFEPAPDNYRYLRANLERNCPHGNVEIFNLALFDRTCRIEFELSHENLGDHRIRLRRQDGAWNEADRTVIEVAAEPLDAVLDAAQLRQPIAVKIDTQGAESQVIAGGSAVLASAAVLAFEFWPYGVARADGDVDFLADFIARHFQEGAIASGDAEEVLHWRPVSFITTSLRDRFRRDRHAPFSYADIFLRK